MNIEKFTDGAAHCRDRSDELGCKSIEKMREETAQLSSVKRLIVTIYILIIVIAVILVIAIALWCKYNVRRTRGKSSI